MMERYDRSRLDAINFNDFYIHNLSEEIYTLRLPLPPHRKTVHDLILLTQGTMKRSVGLEMFDVRQDSVFLLQAGSITATQEISNDIQGFYCHFSTEFLAPSPLFHAVFPETIGNAQPHYVLELAEQSLNAVHLILKRLEYLYKTYNGMASYRDVIKSYLITMLLELQPQICSLNLALNAKPYTASERLTQEFTKLAYKHIYSVHSPADYAAMLHVSPNHLNKTIKSVLGQSPSVILAQLLVLEAKTLLAKPHLSIADIAAMIGFADPSYFGRFFKKATNQTPRDFRAEILATD